MDLGLAPKSLSFLAEKVEVGEQSNGKMEQILYSQEREITWTSEEKNEQRSLTTGVKKNKRFTEHNYNGKTFAYVEGGIFGGKEH